MPTTVDTLFTPLITAAQACLCAALDLHPAAPAMCCVRYGGEVTINDCCPGLAWVRFESADPTDKNSFPSGSADINKCAHPVGQWAVQLELGIARCAPNATATHLPTCDEWATVKHAVMADMQAMRRAICCIQDAQKYRDLVIGQFITTGPAGGCLKTTVDVTVRLVGCDECI